MTPGKTKNGATIGSNRKKAQPSGSDPATINYIALMRSSDKPSRSYGLRVRGNRDGTLGKVAIKRFDRGGAQYGLAGTPRGIQRRTTITIRTRLFLRQSTNFNSSPHPVRDAGASKSATWQLARRRVSCPVQRPRQLPCVPRRPRARTPARYVRGTRRESTPAP